MQEQRAQTDNWLCGADTPHVATRGSGRQWIRTVRLYRAIAAAMCGALCQQGGSCLPVFSERFRDAALPEIESGIDAILDGLVDGVFAAVETRADSDN